MTLGSLFYSQDIQLLESLPVDPPCVKFVGKSPG